MALDKKSSMYSNGGTIGSPEDLDAYGVWVKSEPQDITSSFAEAMGFGSEAMPFESNYDSDMGSIDTGFDIGGFDIGFDDFGVSGFSDISGDSSPEMEMGDFTVTGFDDVTPEESDQDELDSKSNKLLVKIAEELTSIRTELSTLKQEFSGIHTESGSGGKTEAEHGSGFFTEDDDDTIALTDDEMDSIFTPHTFDTLRDEDAAALKRLSEENEAAMFNENAPDDSQDDEIVIDFDNLGINFAEEEPQDDSLTASGGDPLENLDELRDLRLEGVDPLTPAPDDTSYLEDDLFAFEESPIGYDDISFEDSGAGDPGNDPLEINLDDFATLSSLELEDSFGSEDDFASIDLSGAIDEPQFSADSLDDLGFLMDLPAGIDELAADYPVIDDISLDFNAFETSADSDISDSILADSGLTDSSLTDSGLADSGLAEVIPEGFEMTVDEDIIPFDDDLDVPEIAAVNNEEPLAGGEHLSSGMKSELKDVLSYMDHLLESLPEDKIKEFARSEHFETYKKLFKELGLV